MFSEESSGEASNSEEVITATVKSLEDDPLTDAALLKVLVEHIARVDPKDSAIADAVRDIETLAERRAEEPEDGNHD